MTELQQGLMFPVKVFPSIAYAFLYALGGLEHLKYLRHWIAPIVFCAGCGVVLIILNDVSLLALSLLTIFIPAHFPYGADKLLTKIFKRFIYGLAYAVCALAIGYFYHSLSPAYYQIFLSISASIYFGVINPCQNAEDEQGLIGLFSVFLIPFML